MARLPRLNLPGISQHVVQRGNNRQVCFFAEQDYTVYFSKLKEYSQKYKVAVHSYILMTNHVHLLLTPEEGDSVSRLIQSLGRYYVRYVNQTYGTVEYPWSSYQRNAMGKPIALLVPHDCYQSLGKDDKKRQEIYKSLFDQDIPDYTLKEIRDAINKAWILGDDRFKKQVETQAGRRASPMVRGGDRKSERYKADQLL